jgi:hypothetical protein
MIMSAKNPIDPWLLQADGTLDPFAGTVDFGMTTRDEVDPNLLDDEVPAVLSPDLTGNQPPAPSEEPVESPSPVAEPEPEGPEIIDIGDGATILRTKEKGQWKAVLDPGTGASPEVFWGKTKDELLVNALTGKLNATRKIRELNKKVKLTATAPQVQRQPESTPVTRQLTADEIFEVKALWESDPAAALDLLVKKRTNVSLEDLVVKAQRGDQANMNLETESISREFLARTPEYYPDSNNQNFQSLIKWLAKFKLGKNATEQNAGEIFTELWQTGNYTVENLEEAFEDLTADGMLVKPRLPKQTPQVNVPEPEQPAPATPTPRIVKTETRPRAALGIQRSDASAAPPPATPSAPTDEDLDNLSDEQIKTLLGQVRRVRVAARRS